MPASHIAHRRWLPDGVPRVSFGLSNELASLARRNVLHAALLGGIGWVAAWLFIALPWGFAFPLLPTSERMAQGVGLLRWPFCILLIWLGAATLPSGARHQAASGAGHGGMVRRVLALWLASGALLIGTFGATAALQWIDGRIAPSFAVYAAAGAESFWLLCLAATFSVAMPVLLGSKRLGACAAAALLAAWLASREAWPGSLPFSEMIGPAPEPFRASGLHWSALAAALALLSSLAEGQPGTVRERLAAGRLRSSPSVRKAFALAAMLWLASGAWLWHQGEASGDVGALGQGVGADASDSNGRAAQMPELRPLAVDLQAAIFPRQGRAELVGSVLFGNLGVEPLAEFVVFVPPGLRLEALQVDARPIAPARGSGLRRYAFHSPLRPTERAKLTFAGTWQASAQGLASGPSNVLENGTVLILDAIMPGIAAAPASRLAEPVGKWGEAITGACPQARNVARTSARVRLATRLSTSLDQRAVAPGALRRDWQENDRRYFEFETRAPVPLDASVHSARYAVASAAWNGVPVEVFHHPGHVVHARAMLAASLLALRRHEGAFGAYPFAAFRIIEVPHDGCAAAAGGIARRAEGLAFGTDLDNPRGVERLFAAIESDVAGQWPQAGGG